VYSKQRLNDDDGAARAFSERAVSLRGTMP